ncbi:uncharacterized protein [Zea mays]|uniref:uncharacterized protein isoform X3 n=1 Tax=Zea mays TaxID=4577 RepID=UPI0016528594|nr:uncharacterized protein LOC103646909 isoform X3 [Zea mays]
MAATWRRCSPCASPPPSEETCRPVAASFSTAATAAAISFTAGVHWKRKKTPRSKSATASPQAGEATEDDEDIGRILCDCIGDDFSNYNRAIVETVQTGYGPAEVIYAVLSNGVQGRVAVKLARPPVSKAGEEDATTILGRIVARSKLFDVGCVLFYKEGDNGVNVRPGGLIQLAREALAVPLHMPLTIELDLHRCSGDEIVGGVLEFNPATNGQHTERLVGENGAELEVAISWSQYPCLAHRATCLSSPRWLRLVH